MNPITQVTKANYLSNRYQFVDTNEIIEAFAKKGWQVTYSKVENTLSKQRQGFQKHKVRMRQHNPTSLHAKDDVFPEIIIVNSHDGTSSFKLELGLFRLICSNGMVVNTANFMESMYIHTKHNLNELVKQAIAEIMEKAPVLAERIEHFKQIKLNEELRLMYAKQACKLKDIKSIVNYQELLKPKRKQDEEPTLWNTYSIIQEKFTKGGSYSFSFNQRNRPMPIISRGVTAITHNLELNKGLWQLTEQFAEEAEFYVN